MAVLQDILVGIGLGAILFTIVVIWILASECWRDKKMKMRIMYGKKYYFRGRHRKRSAAEDNVRKLQRGGRLTRIIEKDGMFHVWATSIMD